MIIVRSGKASTIAQLASLAENLSYGGKVKKRIYNRFFGIYELLRHQTTDEVRYIEVEEQELDVLGEYIFSISRRKKLLACVYLGSCASVYAKQKVEQILEDMTAIYTFPTGQMTSKIIIYISFIKDGYKCELYDVDFATSML